MGKEYDSGGYEGNDDFTPNKIFIRHSKQLYYSMGKLFEDIVLKMTQLVKNPKTPYRKKLEKILEMYNLEQ